jgi:hypothetical protein
VNCLDAETLAAWMDGGLDGAALEDVRAHVADCGRCQALAGALGRTRTAVPAIEAHPAPRRWLMWAVPLAAAATAIAVWVAIPEQRNAAVVPAAEAPLQKEEPAAPPPPATAAESRNAAVAPAPAPKAERSDDIAQLAPDTVITETVPPPLAPAPPAASAAAAPPAPPPSEQRSAGVAGQLTPQARTVERALERDAAAVALCGPPPPAGTAEQLAASSPAPGGVCWVVGRGGIVLRSRDGRTWQRINFPEGTDLTSVRATDAQTVTVVTADGRTFSTVNGGQTWAVR